MITILIIGITILIIWLVFKFWFFRPKSNIYYLVSLFDKEYRYISVVGEDDDSGALTPLIRPIEKIVPFTFKFQKLVSRQEAMKKEWPITFEFENDKKVIVEREEEVPGWRAIELHAVGIEAVTENGIDISMGIECAYKPLPGRGPIDMKIKVKNWSAFADTKVQNVFSAWIRSQTDDTQVLKITIEQILHDVVANKLFKLSKTDKDVETVYDYLNEMFNEKGFELTTMTLYKVVNGPQSQDVKNRREAIKLAQLDLDRADLERQTEVKKGMAKVELKNEDLKNQASYIASVTSDPNKTAVAVAKELGNGNISTLVLGNGFDAGSFTGTKAGIQSQSKTT